MSSHWTSDIYSASSDYVNYHHEDRIDDSLSKDTPNGRPAEKKPSSKATVISSARLGGLHHRYAWEEAA